MIEAVSHVAWTAGTRKTNYLKPVDKAIFGMVSEPPSRNASEHIGSLEILISGGRAPAPLVKAVWVVKDGRYGYPLRRGCSDSRVARVCFATGEALPAPGRNPRRMEGPITGNTGKWTGRREGGGWVRSSNEGGQCLWSEGTLLSANPLSTREARVR
jgi:hypothetical protein